MNHNVVERDVVELHLRRRVVVEVDGSLLLRVVVQVHRPPLEEMTLLLHRVVVEVDGSLLL